MLNVLLTAVLSMELHLLFRHNVLRIGEIFPTGRWSNIPAIHQTYSNSITSSQSKLQPVCFSYHDLFGQKRIGCVDEEWRGILFDCLQCVYLGRVCSYATPDLTEPENLEVVCKHRSYSSFVHISCLFSECPCVVVHLHLVSVTRVPIRISFFICIDRFSFWRDKLAWVIAHLTTCNSSYF